MNRTHLEIRSPGAYASIQDAGRPGLRRLGVPVSGTLEPTLLALANALVSNALTHPAIECFDGGQVVAAQQHALQVAVAGWARLEVQRDGHRQPVPAWQSLTLHAGDSLRIVGFDYGRMALLAVRGLSVPLQFGSAATYARAALGGLHGRALRAGDNIEVHCAAPAQASICHHEQRLGKPPAHDTTRPIHVIPGPQADYFEPLALHTLSTADYHIGMAADRMGIRLAGPGLAHKPERGSEIVSDAIVPGAIQVPGNGQAIVLLADAQTAGGYPKIATVISADLGRLANWQPGKPVRFALTDSAQGALMARLAADALTARIAGMVTIGQEAAPDLQALYSGNLISGAINAKNPFCP